MRSLLRWLRSVHPHKWEYAYKLRARVNSATGFDECYREYTCEICGKKKVVICR